MKEQRLELISLKNMDYLYCKVLTLLFNNNRRVCILIEENPDGKILETAESIVLKLRALADAIEND